MRKEGAVLQLNDKVAIDESRYATIAEAVVSEKGAGGSRVLKSTLKPLSMSKLRGIYGLITNVYTRVNSPENLDQNISDLQYIKVKMAYESGRDSSAKDFISKAGLMHLLDQIKTYDQFILYCRYAESLVAYFKFYGGKE